MKRIGWVAIATLALLAIASPAVAFHGASVYVEQLDDRVILTGGTTVLRPDHVRNVVVLNGDVVVKGLVHGYLIALNGSVTVDGGMVVRSLYAANGPVLIKRDSGVFGDIRSNYEPVIEEGGVVRGSATQWELRSLPSDIRQIYSLDLWLLVTMVTFAVGILFLVVTPRAAERLIVGFEWDRVRSTEWGLVMAAAGPVVGLIAIVGLALLATTVAPPLTVIVGLLLAIVYLVGYVAGALLLGNTLHRSPLRPIGAFLFGWAGLRVAAGVPFIGAFAGFFATIVGLGAIALQIVLVAKESRPSVVRINIASGDWRPLRARRRSSDRLLDLSSEVEVPVSETPIRVGAQH